MAVKVRCPTCDKVLNAPDAARGKAIKCPECDTKVKVPTGDSSAGGAKAAVRKPAAKVPAKKRTATDEDEFLARLDLDEVVDSSHQMCPKCGAEIPEEATECPNCGVDPTTGQLTAAARKRKGQKGPDPALFYSTVWKDSWSFMMENKRVAFRTALYLLLFSVLQGGCEYMAVEFCTTWPPQVFWGVMYFASSLVIPGWVWCLTIETVRTTVARKSSIREVHFDIFQNIALGLKTMLWSLAFWIWFPPALVMYPLAMIHMAMPVTKRGWMSFAMVSTFFRNFGPTMYYWVIAFVTNLLPSLIVGISAFFSVATIIAMVRGTEEKPSTTALVVAGVILGIGVIIAIVLYSFIMIFNMRVIGMMAYYLQNSLDLVTIVSEKVYVRKEVRVDAFGNVIKTPGQKAAQAMLIVGLVLVVLGILGFVAWKLFFQEGT